MPNMNILTIYMPLLNEGTDVWAPVRAERLAGDKFRVLGPMPADQEWTFRPGVQVRVQRRIFDSASEQLAAVEIWK